MGERLASKPAATVGVIGKAEQSRRTRSLIVETGAACLARYGYAQTTMLLISKEAGISRGPLHYHFRDRNEVMSAIAEALPRGATRAVLDRLRMATTLEARLTTLIDIAIEEHTGDHHYVAMELLMAARNDPDLAAAIAPHLGASEAQFDDWWADFFVMLKWPRERLIAFRRVAVACLRGLALDHVLQPSDETHGRALLMFRDMFLSYALKSSDLSADPVRNRE